MDVWVRTFVLHKHKRKHKNVALSALDVAFDLSVNVTLEVLSLPLLLTHILVTFNVRVSSLPFVTCILRMAVSDGNVVTLYPLSYHPSLSL